MKLSEFTKSEHAAYKRLKVIEYHTDGMSMYGFGDVREEDGHAKLYHGDGGTDPGKDGFQMCLNIYKSSMDFAEITKTAGDLVIPSNKERLRETTKMRSAGKDWYGGFTSHTDGYDMIANGWEEGAKKATVKLGDIKVPDIDGIESMRRTLVFADYGETLNIDQAMAGNWEKAWQTCRRIRSGVSRVLSIAIPYGGNCDKNSEQMFWNGAQGMVITDILEDKGYRVQLLGIHAAIQRVRGTNWDVDIVKLKNSDEPIRMDAIAAVVAHAGVFRTAGFASILSKPQEVDYGLGCCREESCSNVVTALGKLDLVHPDTIVLDGAYSQESAVDNIIRFFAKLKERGNNEKGNNG